MSRRDDTAYGEPVDIDTARAHHQLREAVTSARDGTAALPHTGPVGVLLDPTHPCADLDYVAGALVAVTEIPDRMGVTAVVVIPLTEQEPHPT